MQPDLEDLDQEIAQVRRDKEAATARQDSQVATALRDKEKQLPLPGLTGRRSGPGPLLAAGRWPGNWTG